MRGKKLRRNIKLDYLFSGMNNITLINAIWMLYFVSKGLSLVEIGIIETIYFFVSFVGEVPTGAVADIYGRKTSRIIGKIVSVLGTIIILISQNIWGVGFGFILTAIAGNLESGTGRALIYDTLLEMDKEDKFSSILSKLTIVMQITGIINILLGGYIATVDYDSVYKLSILIGCITLFIAFLFTEPNIKSGCEKTGGRTTMLIQIINTTKMILHNKILSVAILYDAISATIVASVFMYMQLLFKSQGLNEFEIAVSMVLGGVAAIISSSLADKLKSKFQTTKLLIILSVAWVLGAWGMVISSLQIVSFFLIYGIQALTGIYNNSIINAHAESDKRATILSFSNMVFSVFMMISLPVWGWIGDNIGINFVFLIFAIITTLCLPLLSVITYMLVLKSYKR
ncbi:MAG: MFS transporter [Senegalia sp. (in: firmicutes)]|uniref:MFS transporter n=1 Tax=Senegalia sp. (in: firmicutes) TaxID=1924098 RepID=UPI003F967C13